MLTSKNSWDSVSGSPAHSCYLNKCKLSGSRVILYSSQAARWWVSVLTLSQHNINDSRKKIVGLNVYLLLHKDSETNLWRKVVWQSLQADILPCLKDCVSGRSVHFITWALLRHSKLLFQELSSLTTPQPAFSIACLLVCLHNWGQCMLGLCSGYRSGPAGTAIIVSWS